MRTVGRTGHYRRWKATHGDPAWMMALYGALTIGPREASADLCESGGHRGHRWDYDREVIARQEAEDARRLLAEEHARGGQTQLEI